MTPNRDCAKVRVHNDKLFLGSMDILHRKKTREELYAKLFSDTPVVMEANDLSVVGILEDVFELNTKIRDQRFYIRCTLFDPEDGTPYPEEGYIDFFEGFNLYA